MSKNQSNMGLWIRGQHITVVVQRLYVTKLKRIWMKSVLRLNNIMTTTSAAVTTTKTTATRTTEHFEYWLQSG
jgi:hypothetical protein